MASGQKLFPDQLEAAKLYFAWVAEHFNRNGTCEICTKLAKETRRDSYLQLIDEYKRLLANNKVELSHSDFGNEIGWQATAWKTRLGELRSLLALHNLHWRIIPDAPRPFFRLKQAGTTFRVLLAKSHSNKATSRKSQIPKPPEHYTDESGRSEKLRQLLEKQERVVISQIPCMGKTALASTVALHFQQSKHFKGGVVWIVS